MHDLCRPKTLSTLRVSPGSRSRRRISHFAGRVVVLRMVGARILPSGYDIVIDFDAPWRRIRRLHRTYHRATLLSMSGLASLPATFTTGEAVAHGVHPRDLYEIGRASCR